MRDDTLFRIASMTKPIVGVGVMLMVEENKLHLDDPVSRYVPEFRNLRVAVRAARRRQRRGAGLRRACRCSARSRSRIC